jgi:hypothetical protein
MGVILRVEHEVDVSELVEQLSVTDRWALLDELMDDLAKNGTEEDWVDFWSTYQGWPVKEVES